jgi:hypothetical protein
MVWGLLILNAITFTAGTSLLIPIPHRIGELLSQGALPLALVLALTVNRRIVIRPNLYLCLFTLLVIEALVTTLEQVHLGSVYRIFRFTEFIAVLWLLTPWWGRRDMLLLRWHLTWLWVLLGSVIVGAVFHPGRALGGGRLIDIVWPVQATEVGHYAAVAIGLAVVMWLGGLQRGRITLCAVVIAGVILLLSHTRTSLIAMMAGILIAGVSLFVTRGRARKFFAVSGAVASIGVLLAASVVTTYLDRGQSGTQLTSLTGRTDFWGQVIHFPRDRFEEIFGFGLSNTSVNGLPIDSNWLVAYMQMGLFGVVVLAAIALLVLVAAFFQPPSLQRALAFFLITYCLVASFTQVGFADVTTYLLEVTLAMSLLVPSAEKSELPILGGVPAMPSKLRRYLAASPVARGAALPLRTMLVAQYDARVIGRSADWLVRSRETTNFTYDLDPLNRDQLCWFVSAVTGAKIAQVRGWMQELEDDTKLVDHLTSRLSSNPRRRICASEPHWARRAGWYAIVRAAQPDHIVETGTHLGLGSSVIAAALLRNGHGRLTTIDIDPQSGYLIGEPWSSVVDRRIGSSLDILPQLGEVDIFLHDSLHTYDYETREFTAVGPNLKADAIVMSDNAHDSAALSDWAEQTGRHYLFFKEQPDHHWWPGDGIGAAWAASPTD